jgi:hypothetical protein
VHRLESLGGKLLAVMEESEASGFTRTVGFGLSRSIAQQNAALRDITTAAGAQAALKVGAAVLGAVLVGGLITLSVVAAYLYYPDLPTCIHDLRFVESEAHSAALAGDKRRTQVWISAWEDLVRRTEVGIWIRRGRVSSRMTTAAEALRERIEALEHAVLDPDEIDREQVAEELEQVLAAGRAHREALQSACAAGCPSGG